jgi:hypothetical protein
MGKSMRVLLIVSVALGLGFRVVAQEQEPVQVGVKVGSTYSDNRDGTDQNKEDNFDIYAQPRVDMVLDDGQTLFNFYLAPSLLWRSNPRENDEPSPQNDTDVYYALGAAFQQKFSESSRLRLTDDFTYTDDPSVDLGGVNVRENQSYLYNALRADLNGMLSETYGAQVLGGYTLKRYDEDVVADEEDEDVYFVDGILRMQVANGLKLLGQVGYSDFNNESQVEDRGVQIMTYAVGVEKDLTAKLKSVIKGGVQSAEYSDDNIDSDTSGYGMGEVVLTEAQTRFALGAGYGFYGAYVRPYSSQTRTYVVAKAERDLGTKFTVSAEGQFGRGKYEQEELSSGAQLDGGNDDMLLGAVKGTYKVHRNVDVEVGYQIEDWDSDVRESFTRNLVTAVVKARL